MRARGGRRAMWAAGAAMRGTEGGDAPDLPDVGLAAGRSGAGSLSFPFTTTSKNLGTCRRQDKVVCTVI